MPKPTVSVIMPVFNGELYLRESIESIFSQTYQDFELVIVDDGSNDNTASILNSYSTRHKVKIFTNDSNHGLIYTRNKGIACSTGKYIAMLDSDDIALPTRLEKQVKLLERNPELGMVGSDIELINIQGKLIKVQQYHADSEFIPSILLFQNYFAQSSVMVRRSALPEQAYNPVIPLAEDYDLWVRLAATYKVANLPEVLVKYRIHQTNISTAKATALRENLKQIQQNQLARINIIPTADELELHAKIGLLEVPADKEFLHNAEAWLIKLLAANQRYLYYPETFFEQVVTIKWYEICKASQLGSWAFTKSLTSKAAQKHHFAKLLLNRLIRGSFYNAII